MVKWDQLVFMLLFSSLFFIITLALIFYLRHWASRRLSSANSSSVEGEYFKRYIPELLRPKYDSLNVKYSKKRDGKFRVYFANFISLIILVSSIGLFVFSLEQNMGAFLAPIDLSASEIRYLDYTKHKWHRDIDTRLPNLSKILSGFSDFGFILPYDKRDDKWLFNGKNIRAAAKAQWARFAKRNNIQETECRWDLLYYCQKSHKNWIILVVPGNWDMGAIDEALARGANILVYGPPAQIENYINGVQWKGISFLKAVSKESGEIQIRGDQLLTLGFDAGLILDASATFTGYQAHSKDAQAITFDATYEIDTTKGTRLYAKSENRGRVVWMDFAPDPADHGLDLNVNHLNAIMASVFRYFSRKPYSAIATWPKGKDYAALVDEDTEDKYANAVKVAELAKKYQFPISWYILSNEALKNRSITNQLAQTGEIACHGDHHGVFTLSSMKEQVVRIARCKKVLKSLTGIEPMAFRPPEEKYNSFTIDAIGDNGMDHYIAVNSPDRAVPELMVAVKSGKSLVSIPRMINDDYELWHKRKLSYQETVKIFKGESDWSRLIGGVHMFSFHTQYIDDPDHFKALEYLCERLKKTDAYFETSNTIAKWWRVRDKLSKGVSVPMADIAKYRPVILTVDKNGVLKKSDYHSNSKLM